LIVVPLLASVIIVGKYIRRRLLGLPPFEEDNESILSPDSPSKSKTALKRTPARKKTPK
jgi:hypothetical protein